MSIITESIAPDPASLATALRDLVRKLDPDMPVFDIRTMEEIYTKRAVKTSGVITEAVSAMGVMGMFLAAVGLYGLVAYAVSRRTTEIGLRMALGADRNAVVWMVLRRGLRLGPRGYLGRLGHGFLCLPGRDCHPLTSGFQHVSSLIYIGIALLQLVITVLASWAPARRAARVDPLRALRAE
jgi:ABC-type lipoprotein release transport system permease subunit